MRNDLYARDGCSSLYDPLSTRTRLKSQHELVVHPMLVQACRVQGKNPGALEKLVEGGDPSRTYRPKLVVE
jgi:hypothetical protein